jgi:hypothetical protein
MPAVVLDIKKIGASAGSDDTSTYVEEFLATASDGSALTYADVMSALPAFGTTETVLGVNAYLASKQVDSIEDTAGRAWSVTLSYNSETVDDEFVALDMNSSATAVDFFRSGASAPANLNTPGNSDIGGTPIDQGGQPVTTLVPTQELSITNYRADNNASAIRAALGKRNSTTWLGAAAGYVLFTGATAKRVGISKYEVQYKFVYDDYAHCRQVAIRDLDARPRLSTPDGSGLCNASLVVWRQPFPSTYNFGSMGIMT